MQARKKEVDVETVGQLRAALADLPDDMSVSDKLGDALILTLWAESETDDAYVTIA